MGSLICLSRAFLTISGEVQNCCRHINLFQVVNEPTRGQNMLDLILTSAAYTVGQILTIQGFSDHKLLKIPLYIPLKNTSFTTKKIRDYNRGNYKDMNSDLEKFFHQEFMPSFTVRYAWRKLGFVQRKNIFPSWQVCAFDYQIKLQDKPMVLQVPL